MNDSVLQSWLDRIALTSAQRWGLIALAVLSTAVASVVAAGVGGHQRVDVTLVIAAVALAATLRADGHTALVAVALVVWQWAVSADDVATPWSIAVAVCLLVFHSTIALMAVTPITATVDRGVCRAWITRGAWVMAATIAVWAVVVVFDQSSGANGVVLTVAAFAVLTGLVLAARWQLAKRTPAESG